MAQQSVTGDRYPYLPLRLSVHGRRFTVDALADTGFDGELVAPTQALNQDDDGPADDQVPIEVADGRKVSAPLYSAMVHIGTFPPFPAVVAVLGDTWVVGRGILDRFKVTFDHGRTVTLEP